MNDLLTPALHPKLEAFRTPGGMFDVEPCELDLNLGRKCRFTKPSCTDEQDVFTVCTLQKNFRGDICYRVVGDQDSHRIGRVALPTEIVFIDEV